MAGQNFDLTGYLQQVANDKRARNQNRRYQQKHDLEIAGLERKDEAEQRAERERRLNEASSVAENTISRLRDENPEMTREQAVMYSMSNPQVMQAASIALNNDQELLQSFTDDKNRGGFRTDFGVGKNPIGLEHVPAKYEDETHPGLKGERRMVEREHWIPTFRTEDKEAGIFDTVTGLWDGLTGGDVPMTENKTSDPNDPVVKLYSEDIREYLDKVATSKGTGLNLASNIQKLHNEGLKEGAPTMTERESIHMAQMQRAGEASLGGAFTAPGTYSTRTKQYETGLAAQVKTEEALATAKTNREKAEKLASYNLALKAQEQTAAQKKSLAETAQKAKIEEKKANAKLAIENIKNEVEQGNFAAVKKFRNQLPDTASPAMKKQADTFEKRALIKSLRKLKFGHTNAWEWWDKSGWAKINGSEGYVAGDMDVTSDFKKRMEIDTDEFGTYLYPLNAAGERAGDPMNMNELGDAERAYIVAELDPQRKRVRGADGVSVLLSRAQTIRLEERRAANQIESPADLINGGGGR